ncbi:dihydroorotate oxidase B catalytic subunit [Ruminococcaceae bacterium R-25]|nr:dihydroorotate oxidase B catalytic subunit [Ruminococcaceae bacterium R-25]SUQ11352.1 dihydroorotate oxidase B, catalytic subunit [Oscillospiraceae bacterium]
MSASLNVNVGSVNLKSPIILASGTCNFGRELSEYYDLSILGGISSKGLTIKPRNGNPGVRVAECASGMLNSVGLQNPGVHYFIENDLDFMKESGAAVIVNVAGHSFEDYIAMVETLDPHKDKIDALEINLSCPNVKAGCMTIGSDPEAIKAITAKLRSLTDLPLWIKLTPNVTDIKATALAAQEGGADAVVLINTLMGMRINIKTRRPVLTNNTGGYSGPAVKPVAIRMVAEASTVLDIPIVGCGGIESYEDVVEFMIAGASAVEIGTACLVHPALPVKITEDLDKYCADNALALKDLTGTLQRW